MNFQKNLTILKTVLLMLFITLGTFLVFHVFYSYNISDIVSSAFASEQRNQLRELQQIDRLRLQAIEKKLDLIIGQQQAKDGVLKEIEGQQQSNKKIIGEILSENEKDLSSTASSGENGEEEKEKPVTARSIAVASFADSDYELHDISKKDKQEYVERHGYDLVFEEIQRDDSRPIAWAKIVTLLDALNTLEDNSKHGDAINDQKLEPQRKYNWVMWFDADTVITNKRIKIEDIVEKYTAEHKERHFLVAKDFNGMNTGVFLIKNSGWSRRFLEQVYFSHQKSIKNIDTWWEQAVIMKFFEEEKRYQSRLFLIPQEEINSFEKDWKEGDFVIHFAGRSKTKLSDFRKYKELVLN